MDQTAKLFKNGRSQAVRLPAEFRFEGSEVYIRRDQKTGDVVLSKRPSSWDDFFERLDKARAEAPAEFMDFMKHREKRPPKKRNLF